MYNVMDTNLSAWLIFGYNEIMSQKDKQPKQPGNDGNIFRCPICRKYLPSSEVKTFPFCSDQCRLLDLDNWVEGHYKVSRPVDPTDQQDDGGEIERRVIR